MEECVFTVNGEAVAVERAKLHLSVAEYLRQHAHCKSVKVGCAEGGCGACAVELVQANAATGNQSVVAVNSCLLPVAALHGCHVVTSEGLGNIRQGFNEVHKRLAGFHATQCGFCSPGMSVALHAALMAAAQQAQPAGKQGKVAADISPLSSPPPPADVATTGCNLDAHRHDSTGLPDSCSRVCGGAGCGTRQHAGQPGSSSRSIPCSAGAGPTASRLLAALDGNLCRCTGWRPLADVAKSFACDVDIEDLGLCSLPPQQLGPVTDQQQLLPAALKQPLPTLQQQQQQQLAAALHSLRGVILMPTSLQELLAAAAAAHAAGVPVHFLAGNTGAGLFPQQWQSMAGAACILVKHVPELHTLTVQHHPEATQAADTSALVDSSCNGLNGNHHAAMNGHGASGAAGGSPVAAPGSAVAAPALLAGAGVTISQLLHALEQLAASEAAAGRQLGSQSLGFLCAHLHRLAGTLVRNSATLGGHLALVKARQLESDLLPMMIASGAEVQLTDTNGCACWIPVEDFVAAPCTRTGSMLEVAALRSPAVITAVRLPLPLEQPGSRTALWSYKLTTHRKNNEHATVNMCCWLSAAQHATPGEALGPTSCQVRIAVGTYQPSSRPDASSSCSQAPAVGWRCTRAYHVEAALLAALTEQQQQQQQQSSQQSLLHVLARLPELLLLDITPAGRAAEYVRSAAPGLLLKGLAVVLPCHEARQQQQQQQAAASPAGLWVSAAMLHELRAAAIQELSAGSVPRSTQDLPINTEAAAPLSWPTEKDGGILQASGEAEYTDDVALTANALHAAYVTASQAAVKLVEVDWSSALEVPGVVGFVGPADIPAGPSAQVLLGSTPCGQQEPLFAWDTVEYVGQPLGLVLASTQAAARAGAARVRVVMGQLPAAQPAKIASKATEHESGVPPAPAADLSPTGMGVQHVGPVASLSAAVAANSWYDTSTAPAFWPLRAARGDVAAALAGSSQHLSGQLRIGSQRHFYMEPQTAVATPEEGGRISIVSSTQGCDQVLWSVANLLKLSHNQVHVSSRRVGGGFGGKADRALWPAGAAAVAAHKFRRQVRLVVSTSADGSMNAGRCPMHVDWVAGLDDAGHLQALQLDVTCLAGAYFAAGYVEIGSIATTVDSVYDIPAFAVSVRAARGNLPPRSTVRGPGKVSAIIMIEHILQQIAQATGRSPDSLRASLMIKLPQDVVTAAAEAAAADGGGQSGRPVPGGGVLPHPQYHPEGEPLSTTLGKPIALGNYTLPYMWQQLQATSNYHQRRAAVNAFNQANKLKKRGLAMVPTRYQLFHRTCIATVKIYADGSILIHHAGTEMGQGIGTKVMQAAAAALGELLPPHARPQLLQYMRIAFGSTELMPHAGMAAGSTTSEGATVATTLACEELVQRLKPAADKLAAAAVGKDSSSSASEVSWQAIIKAVAPPIPVITSQVVLEATAIGGFADRTAPFAAYHSFGVAAAEVEVDCVTGERRLLSAHLMFDAGRSINPAVDLGQVEGAFMQGVGHVMCEEVVEDEATGATLSNSTWTYKPPGIAELPAEFHVHLLRDSPLHVPKLQQLSAKATGEPPFMMAAAVVCALQDAIGAAWADRRQLEAGVPHQVQLPPTLHLPATVASIKSALPPLWCELASKTCPVQC